MFASPAARNFFPGWERGAYDIVATPTRTADDRTPGAASRRREEPPPEPGARPWAVLFQIYVTYK
ncbi:hypothetical protein GCM10027091_39060 [Streptomyces daliensis]